MSTKNLLASITCALIALVAQPISIAAANPSLAGSWQFTLTPGTPTPGISIPGLATFTADGSVVETDGSEVAPSRAFGDQRCHLRHSRARHLATTPCPHWLLRPVH